jgi:hypothetical protein
MSRRHERHRRRRARGRASAALRAAERLMRHGVRRELYEQAPLDLRAAFQRLIAEGRAHVVPSSHYIWPGAA